MPPSGKGAKSMGKKASAAAIRGQRSRNTTPIGVSAAPPPPPPPPPPPVVASLPPIDEVNTEYLKVNDKLHFFGPITYNDLVDTPTSAVQSIPDSQILDVVIARLKQFSELVEKRGVFTEASLRAITQTKGQENTPAGKPNGSQPTKAKRGKALGSEDVGGGKVAKIEVNSSASQSRSKSLATEAVPDTKEQNATADAKSESSSDEEDLPPVRAKPASYTFGEDPSTYPDPTVYAIPPVTPGMTDEEKKKVFSVAVFPKSDLRDMVAGVAPDKDFSNIKPPNQISFSTFASYIEPYFRPFTDEDLAFLRERNDRVTPFVIPKLGKKYYTQVWAEEDGSMEIYGMQDNQDHVAPDGRGSIEQMSDAVAETSNLSLPPGISRILSAMMHENRQLPADEVSTAANGSQPIYNGGDLDTAMAELAPSAPIAEDTTNALSPATCIPELGSDNFQRNVPPPDGYTGIDSRLRLELEHIGFLSAEDDPPAEYEEKYDDEVCARLRLLQAKLREQVLVNGARKARLSELCKTRMAFQEYTTIQEDLDGQVQSAYLKRTRTIGKTKKRTRPGAANAAATARPGIGDLPRTLMERRRRWMESIGPVFDGEALTKVPRSTAGPDTGEKRPEDDTWKETSIFKPDVMKELIAKEQHAWDEEQEEE